jgi:LacI family transcriptional regulator
MSFKKVILLIDSQRIVGRDILLGAAKYSRLHGPWTLLHELGIDKFTNKQLAALSLDGIVMAEERCAKDVFKMGLPIACLRTTAGKEKSCISIISNDAAIGKLGAEYFIDRGFKRFAFCSFTNLFWAKNRCAAFVETAALAGYSVNIYNRSSDKILAIDNKEQERLANWLAALEKPVGLMVCTDDFGRHVTEACRNFNIKVPEEVAILGVDNDKLVCELCNPPLSSVALNFKMAGFQAAQLLDNLMFDKKIDTNTVVIQPTRVVTRVSSDIVAIEDPLVAEAVKYIRQNSCDAIQVNDVAEALLISRRRLERKFRQVLGVSLLDQISKARTARITQMLTETNLPVSKIADILHFSSIKQLYRLFKSNVRMNPIAYRRKYGSDTLYS